MEEIWKDVKDYEGLYQVSNLGRVKRLKGSTCRKTGDKIMTASKNSNKLNPYWTVMLCKDNHPKRFTVHRLVAEAFIPNPNNLPQINHIDENKHNNVVENLEWCTAQYNLTYGTVLSRRCMKLVNGKGSKKVNQYDRNGNFINCFPSTKEAFRVTGISHCHICNCCAGRRKSAGGFIWKYAPKGDNDNGQY